MPPLFSLFVFVIHYLLPQTREGPHRRLVRAWRLRAWEAASAFYGGG